MLELKNISKSYGRNKVLKNIDLHLEEGVIYGLLGRNGVGKSTLLNIISGQVRNDEGELLLDGNTIFENQLAIDDICLVKEKGLPLDDERIKYIFKVASLLYKDWDEEYKDRLVKEFNLDIRRKYHKLSRGTQTIVGLIIGLASKARLTMFDEPSLGLDAAHRDRFYNLLLRDNEEGQRTFIISTHLIDEVTNIFEEVIILKDGAVYLKDEVSNILEDGYYLNGKEENILSIVKNKNIIHKEQFGPSVIIGIFDSLDKEEKEELKGLNVEISKIPLQKLFVYMTDKIIGEGVI